MAALNFPSNPSNGDTYGKYVYNAEKGVWSSATQSGVAGSVSSFTTIATPLGTNPSADSAMDTLTFVAGSGVEITGNSANDSVTIASTVNSFNTISTPSGTSPAADSTSDTLTLSAGTGITITGDSSADSVTIATSGLVSQTNGTVTTASTSQTVVRNITLSTSQPSGGNDGDVWLVYA